MIEFQNVSKIYKETRVRALRDISLRIEKGEFVFLIGATGAGKTTMIKLLLREEVADRGRVIIDGVDVARMSRRRIPQLRRGIGVVFQDFRLLPERTVYENAAFAMQVVGTPKRVIRHIVPQVLELVGLSDKAAAKPGQLSGGEQQRASMARALVNNPPLLIADEPTGNLDPETSGEIMALLDRINRRGTTVIVATHAKELVDRMQKEYSPWRAAFWFGMRPRGGMTLFRALGYFLTRGFKNIWGNRLMSVASAGIVAASLILFGIFLLAGLNINALLRQVEDQCEINVYLAPDAGGATLNQIEGDLRAIPGVREVRFFSREERLERAKETTYQGKEYMLEDLETDNPLRDSLYSFGRTVVAGPAGGCAGV